jgi:hypothetical protein
MPSIDLRRDKIILIFHINTYPYLIVIDLINWNLLDFFSSVEALSETDELAHVTATS